MVSGKAEKDKRRRKLEDLVDKQMLYQLCVENKIISRALELEQRRVKRRMHSQYVV
ncbi:MAG: hypothetical protein QXQ61_04855 [Candidatus Bathyarchaeia archaeon]